MRYSSKLNVQNVSTMSGKSTSSRLSKFLQKSKEKIETNESKNFKDQIIDKKITEEKINISVGSTPFYQLKEFLEALTTRAEDARIVIQKATSPLDFAKLVLLKFNKILIIRKITLKNL